MKKIICFFVLQGDDDLEDAQNPESCIVYSELDGTIPRDNVACENNEYIITSPFSEEP